MIKFEPIEFPMQLVMPRQCDMWIRPEHVSLLNHKNCQPLDEGDVSILFNTTQPRLVRYVRNELDYALRDTGDAAARKIIHKFQVALPGGFWSTRLVSGDAREIRMYQGGISSIVRQIASRFESEELQVMCQLGLKLPQ
jgi:hypothetical protein